MTEEKITIAKINGKTVAYTKDSKFFVQTGKSKSKYKTRYTITGNLGQALMYYSCINIGNGYKKRLMYNGVTLMRVIS